MAEPSSSRSSASLGVFLVRRRGVGRCDPGARRRVVAPTITGGRRSPSRDPVGRPPEATRVSTSHRGDIQGLRAVAVLLVVLAHAGIGGLAGGFVGVDVFFVLSGFLITGLLLTEARARGSISLLGFYVRRARRILPAAAVTLVVTDAAAVYLLNFVRAREAVVDSVHAAAFAANFQFAAHGVDYFARTEPPSPLLHYWSLSVEEQFYLVWPLLLGIALFGGTFVRRYRAASKGHEGRLLGVVVVLAAASLAWSLHLTSAAPTTAYFSPFTRAWELGLGAALAVGATTIGRIPAPAKIVLGWTGMLAIVASAVVFSDGTPFPGYLALLPTIGAALAIVAGTGDRLPRLSVARLLSLRPMRVVGDRSYALYLWHWPVLILAVQYAGSELSATVKLGLVVGAFLLSCVSYSLVENPIRQTVRSRAATAIVVAVSMAAVLGTAAVSLAATNREEQRFETPVAASAQVVPASFSGSRASARQGALPAVVAAVRAARRGAPIPSGLAPALATIKLFPRRYRIPPACIAHDATSKAMSRVCRIGQASSTKLIVLFGDSHAFMWLPAVLEMARHDGWAVVPLIRFGCTPALWITHEGSDVCRAWYRWGVAQIRRLHPAATLLTGRTGEEPSPDTRAATAGLISGARTLSALGPLVVIGDPEGVAFDPVSCLLASHASMSSCTTTWAPRSLAAYDTVARATKRLSVGFLPTRGFVCYQRECPAVVGHTTVWMDDSHITGLYSAQLAGPFRAGFLRSRP